MKWGEQEQPALPCHRFLQAQAIGIFLNEQRWQTEYLPTGI